MSDSLLTKFLPLYAALAEEITQQINTGVFKPGDRLPSVRTISQQKRISVTTVLQAYQMLEDRGTIEARPQSGYYVKLQPLPCLATPEPETSTPPSDPRQINRNELIMQVHRSTSNPNLVQFGSAIPDPELLPTDRINSILARIARQVHEPLNVCGNPEGCPELRAQVARRAFLSGCNLSPDDFIITSGCTEAMYLALKAVCKPGDLVAIESPTYFGILQTLESCRLRALEIPTHHRDGISLDALAFAIEHHPVRAVLIVPNFSNPLGSVMPDENKRRLVELLAHHEIPLIEDDINGDLTFNNQRPDVVKSYDEKGLVLLCSSFSKEIAPGYRVGWVTPGRWKEDMERLKIAINLGTPILPQLAIADYLENGGYDHLLRKIRRAYAQKMAYMANAVMRYFPSGTRVTSPEGGFVLWVQMSENIDSLVLYQMALQSGISLAPGYIFSATSRYSNFIRLNTAYMSFSNERAIKRLGELAASCAGMNVNPSPYYSYT
jgi:DNA-binding transcriptional MocR family regulator